MINKKINEIISLLKEKKSVDFSGYRFPILERRIQKRIDYTNSNNFNDYHSYLLQNPDEFENLFDVLALNVSHFFRNALTFEIIRKNILPEMITAKAQQNEKSLRIWSAGCSNGEEPYSVAILLKEILYKNEKDLQVNIFATDIDEKSLKQARNGNYKPSSIKNVKYSILNKYFVANKDYYMLNDEVKRMVKFSFFDLADKKSNFPSESIYGGFDIVFCRNVLIYFDLETQKIIFNKLYKSLNKNGYLILGEAESPPEEFKNKFQRENVYCKIYLKTG